MDIKREESKRNTLGTRIKELRDQMNLSQSDVAKAANISQGSVSAYENGTLPKVEALIYLAKYFNVTTDYLLGISSTAKPVPDDNKDQNLLIRLSRIPMRDISTPPSSAAISSLINAIIAYIAAGSPAGSAPIDTAGKVILALTNLLDAAASDSLVDIIDKANVLASAGLSATETINGFVDRQKQE